MKTDCAGRGTSLVTLCVLVSTCQLDTRRVHAQGSLHSCCFHPFTLGPVAGASRDARPNGAHTADARPCATQAERFPNKTYTARQCSGPPGHCSFANRQGPRERRGPAGILRCTAPTTSYNTDIQASAARQNPVNPVSGQHSVKQMSNCSVRRQSNRAAGGSPDSGVSIYRKSLRSGQMGSQQPSQSCVGQSKNQ